MRGVPGDPADTATLKEPRHRHSVGTRVAIVGGGIAGLACAHYLNKAGVSVTLFEASGQFGGLGTFFCYKGTHLERFYHCLLPGDDHLLSLLRDLGIDDRVYWRTAEFGFLNEGQLYGLNTPKELLNFKPLPFMSRIRVGLTGLYTAARSPKGLDDITCEEWLLRLCGRRALELFWKPMFEAKFGNRWHDVPALWFWTRFNREKGTTKEVKGYIRGGYKHLTDVLVSSLRARGANLLLNTPVQSLDLDERGLPCLSVQGSPKSYDRVIVATPLSPLRHLARGSRITSHMQKIDPDIDYQGVINVLFIMRRALTPYYWVAAMDSHIPFQGIVESSALLDREDAGGFHLAYMMNYVHRNDRLFRSDDEDLIEAAFAGLKSMFPDFMMIDIIDRFVFRAAFVEPLYTRGYLRRRPPEELVPDRVYLATTAQVYPEVTSWNSSVSLAQRVVERIIYSRQEKGR